MKSGKTLTVLAAVWILFILFDNFSGLTRIGYVRKMRDPLKTLYFLLKSVRSVLIFAIAVMNILMVAGQLRQEHRISRSSF